MFTHSSPVPRKFISPRRQSGFSLVEVVLAVGVIAFAFVAILGLLPAGLTQFRQAMDNSLAAQIAQRVIEDAQGTDFDILTDAKNRVAGSTDPIYAKTYSSGDTSKSNALDYGLRYFDEQGNEVVPKQRNLSKDEANRVIYYVITRVMPAATVPGAGNDSVNPCLAGISVQVVFNPGNIPLKFLGNKLIDTNDTRMRTLPIRTFNSHLGRSQ